MGFLNPYTSDLIDLTLLFQIIILALLLLSILFKYKRNYHWHGVSMGTGLILHLISIAMVMIPSLMGFRGLFENPTNFLAITILSHSFLGIAVLVLGGWLVAAWAVSPHEVASCFKRKKIMDLTLIFWLTTLTLGIFTYLLLYTPI
jgi:uncharacterized membrane protein YozB (DUF420 family)